jgi:hypothetical protein
MSTVIEQPDPSNVAYRRLEDQLQWYDKKSAWNKTVYKQLKLLALVVAVSIPLVALTGFVKITAVLGAMIAFLEGLQQLNQYHDNWTSYRSTAEALKHEKFLYLANAGPYAGDTPETVLADRVESLVSQEHAKWASTQQQPEKKDNGNKK